jgi:hypothetical protein
MDYLWWTLGYSTEPKASDESGPKASDESEPKVDDESEPKAFDESEPKASEQTEEKEPFPPLIEDEDVKVVKIVPTWGRRRITPIIKLSEREIKAIKDLNLSEREYNRVVNQALDEKKKNGNQILAKAYLGAVIETFPAIQTYNFLFLKDEKAYQNWLKPKKGFEKFYDEHGDNQLSVDEYKLIYKSLREVGQRDFHDVKNIRTKVLFHKRRNGGKTLKAMKFLRETESYPAHAIFQYFF